MVTKFGFKMRVQFMGVSKVFGKVGCDPAIMEGGGGGGGKRAVSLYSVNKIFPWLLNSNMN